MKKHSILKPVQDWFKAVGAIGKGHHASQTGDEEYEQRTVISSPKPPEQKPQQKKKK